MAAFVESTNIICSLGFSTEEVFGNMCQSKSGIALCNDESFSKTPFQASAIDYKKLNVQFPELQNHNRFDQLILASAISALKTSSIDTKSGKTVFILSTTKGNVELLNSDNTKNNDALYLWKSAEVLGRYFNNPNPVQVVSNACISGLAAIVIGQRLINAQLYDNVVIVGADIISQFVVSGFQSFMSLSPEPCKPFDANRDGLTLGEAAATIVLTNQSTAIEVINGATSNDANHISGPSRTGEGLYLAINQTLKGLKNIDFISAHGTATPYNDDMESKAIIRNQLDKVPTNSMKGYFGHTLGAAGVIESIISVESLKNNIILASLGTQTVGVAEPITIATQNIEKPISRFLKIASGFGGSNAAALFVKHA